MWRGRGYEPIEAAWQREALGNNQMEPNLAPSSVEDLNLALRHYRRLLRRSVVLFVVGLAAVVGLDFLGTYLAPPYGLYIFGQDLSTWGLTVLLVLVVAECWWEGRAIGRALDDPNLRRFPVVGLMSGLTTIAQQAKALDMEWSPFLGPLRPRRKR